MLGSVLKTLKETFGAGSQDAAGVVSFAVAPLEDEWAQQYLANQNYITTTIPDFYVGLTASRIANLCGEKLGVDGGTNVVTAFDNGRAAEFLRDSKGMVSATADGRVIVFCREQDQDLYQRIIKEAGFSIIEGAPVLGADKSDYYVALGEEFRKALREGQPVNVDMPGFLAQFDGVSDVEDISERRVSFKATQQAAVKVIEHAEKQGLIVCANVTLDPNF